MVWVKTINDSLVEEYIELQNRSFSTTIHSLDYLHEWESVLEKEFPIKACSQAKKKIKAEKP